MNLELIKMFIASMEEGSFAAASRVLSMESSKVSRGVQALEAELGAPLFHRTTRNQSPTEAGELLYRQIIPLIGALDDIRERIHNLETAPSGQIRFLAPVSFTLQNVLQSMISFLEKYPEITLDLQLSDRAPDFTRENFDLAITLGLPPNSDAVATKLADMKSHIVTSEKYFKKINRPTSPEQLKDHNCLILDMPGFENQWNFRKHGERETLSVPVSGSLMTSNALALRQAAIQGLGITMQAEWMVEEDLQSGELLSLFPDYEVSSANFVGPAMWLLRSPRAITPHRVSLLKDWLIGSFRSHRVR